MQEENIDYRDIMYFVCHVKNLPFRFSLIEELGYSLGWNVTSRDSKEGSIVNGAQGELRVQIEPSQPKFPLVRCAIIQSINKF